MTATWTRLALAGAVPLAILSVVAAEFGSFNVFEEHPLKDFLGTEDGDVKPVPLHQYYYVNDNGAISMKKSTKYKPRHASYEDSDGSLVFESADALVGVRSQKDLVLKLNRNASVIVVLNGMWSGPDSRTVTQPAGYVGISKVKRVSGDNAVKKGYAVKTYPQQIDGRNEFIVTIPPPASFVVGGDSTASKYTVLLVDPDTDASFEAPITPESLKSDFGGDVLPLVECPAGLHSLWRSYSADTSDEHNFHALDLNGEQVSHSTWHPIIDPVYYCSYGHDHGSYPGPHYKPAYTHTAWHTEDADEESGRQDESDAGFKTFAFVSGSLHWLITVHMQLGNPRRLSTRFHTIQLAIFDVVDDVWTTKVELNYKQDYGFAATKIFIDEDTKRLVPLNSHENEVKVDLQPIKRFRQVNVGQWSDICTFESDKKIRTTPHRKKQGRGSNEHWVTSLNTCGSRKFRIDVSSPATGLKSCDNNGTTIKNDPESLVDKYNGVSIGRTFSSLGNGLRVGSDDCTFESDIPAATADEPLVKFYTDSFFTEVLPASGKFHIAQWIVPGFSATLPKGKYRPESPWGGKFTKDGPSSKFVNFEGWALDGDLN